jgi:hypothetical protein
MPFIDSKITIPLTREQKDTLKTKLGQAVSIIGKPEFYLMVGIDDEYDLYMGGNRIEKGAFVSVSLFGNASSSAYEKMTAEICNILGEFGIPGDKVYVAYQGINDWGWNGSNL